MHVITQRRIRDAKKQFPEASSALHGWFRIIEKNKFDNFSDLKRTFNGVDRVGSFYVFDVGGNKLRLIVTIHFNRQKVYIRHILTHKEYDKGTWK